jgi:hypothetical protein
LLGYTVDAAVCALLGYGVIVANRRSRVRLGARRESLEAAQAHQSPRLAQLATEDSRRSAYDFATVVVLGLTALYLLLTGDASLWLAGVALAAVVGLQVTLQRRHKRRRDLAIEDVRAEMPDLDPEAAEARLRLIEERYGRRHPAVRSLRRDFQSTA